MDLKRIDPSYLRRAKTRNVIDESRNHQKGAHRKGQRQTLWAHRSSPTTPRSSQDRRTPCDGILNTNIVKTSQVPVACTIFVPNMLSHLFHFRLDPAPSLLKEEKGREVGGWHSRNRCCCDSGSAQWRHSGNCCGSISFAVGIIFLRFRA